MPSKLPIIKANTSSDNIIKMKTIAKYNKRSLAKELEYIVEKHIKEFEAEHGEIENLQMTSNFTPTTNITAKNSHPIR